MTMRLQTISSNYRFRPDLSMKKIPKLSIKPAYTTDWGSAYCGDSIALLSQFPDDSVNLVITSPPFALLRKKEYGNQEQHEYIEWLSEFAKVVLIPNIDCNKPYIILVIEIHLDRLPHGPKT